MFGWRRPAGRVVRVSLAPGTLRGRSALPLAPTPSAAGSHSGKALVAYALAHPPTWTNALATGDTRGRAANARAALAHPGILPLGSNPMSPQAQGARS